MSDVFGATDWTPLHIRGNVVAERIYRDTAALIDDLQRRNTELVERCREAERERDEALAMQRMTQDAVRSAVESENRLAEALRALEVTRGTDGPCWCGDYPHTDECETARAVVGGAP